MFVIVSSLFLVVIALDRYFSVVSINRTRWQPSKLFCVISCAFIWTFSAFISSPVIQIYYHFKIYIRKNQKPEGINENLKYYAGYICGRKVTGLWFSLFYQISLFLDWRWTVFCDCVHGNFHTVSHHVLLVQHGSCKRNLAKTSRCGSL